MKQKVASVFYFLTSMMGMLASMYETRIGMVAAYILLAGSVVSFISNARWSLSLPFIGSALLACYVVPAEVRNVVRHPAIFADVRTVALHAVLLGMVTLSLIISAGLLMKSRAAKESSDPNLIQKPRS
jgi:hypothetical protein